MLQEKTVSIMVGLKT